MNICGIDEAGRGCIIGPLVISGVTANLKELAQIEKSDVKDSKLLSPARREELYEFLQKFTYEVLIVPPKEIDKYVLSETGENLNWLEAEKSVEIINRLKPDKVILDCPSPNLKAYKKYVAERLLNLDIDIVVEHKADLNNKIVGAASIIAKVIRDREIEKIRQHVGINFGSGYPSDPLTSAFLQKNWDKHPEIFRHSWAPYQALVKKKMQKRLGEY
ncbi:ribonuclease HII [Candidatus Woesearchaeota archaeon CG10_big_fil_rev_8_21_14_0_10_37_12]|nr:MAG: ribonuclease HII [Candidatus Woesearchaeota archaeon CG10_big_fil_rev_8_21_14_0_10_37_12]